MQLDLRGNLGSCHAEDQAVGAPNEFRAKRPDLANVKMISDRQQAAYDWYKQRERELQAKASNSAGRLERHNWWRYEYYKFPYLLLESSDAIEERFADVFANAVDLSIDGKIVLNLVANDGWFGYIFTELIEETNWRGLLTRDLIANATRPIGAYFQDGDPLGVRMFGDRKTLGGHGLVKYSKREFVEDMYRHGRFRISPASYYSKGGHLKAVKDFETSRSYKLRALNEAMRGEEAIEVKGMSMKITNGVIPFEVEMVDYYLFSTCKDIDRRLPTDFEADAALVISDRRQFVERLKRAMLDRKPDWQFIAAEVQYYDPYKHTPKDRNQEFWKHFSYAYQKEHRCVLRPKITIHDGLTLDPFFLELGPMGDIAEIVNSPT